MMATLVTLKRFDGPKHEASPLASTNSASGSPLHKSSDECSKPDLDPVPVNSSIEQEKTAKLQRGLEAKQRQLVQVLKSLSTELNEAKTKLAIRMGDMIADSTLALLPTLLNSGFAKELSAAVVQLANAIEPEQVALQVHPNDHELVVDALQAIASPHPITVEKDNTIASGSAHITWLDGGAKIDKSALLNHATGLLEIQIASLISGKNYHEY